MPPTPALKGGDHIWSVDYRVVAFEKYTARVGTYDSFKIEGTLKADGMLVFSTTRWWSPELRYILSFRFIKAVADRNGNSFWEVAAVEKHDAP
jgi:hypothetical protein